MPSPRRTQQQRREETRARLLAATQAAVTRIMTVNWRRGKNFMAERKSFN